MSSYITANSAGSALRWDLPVFESERVPPPPPHSARHLDALEQQAYEDGHARGFLEGRAQGRAAESARLSEQTERLKAICDHLARPLHELDAGVERLLLALAVEVGTQLAIEALTVEPERVAGIVRQAVAALTPARPGLSIHLHPADLALLKDTLELPTEAGDWHLAADSALRRGDCLVVTDRACVDARLDTRAASLAQALLGERH